VGKQSSYDYSRQGESKSLAIEKTLLCRLALDEGWFLPFANEAVPKNLPNSFIVRDRFPATHFGDELLERRLNVRKN